MRTSASRRYKFYEIVVAILTVLILLTSTFAWQSFSQLAINNASDQIFQAGGRLHDDFKEEQEWLKGGNEDI